MTVDASGTRLRHRFRDVSRFVRAVSAARSRPTDPYFLLTPEQFQSELAVLGLSGEEFDFEDYASALGRHLRLSIAVRVIPDASYPELSRRLALSGRLAELRLCESSLEAVILMPGSLPPSVSALTVFHELGHLAAGDHLIRPDGASETGHNGVLAPDTAFTRSGRRLARRPPFADERLREKEADLRACYALLAGRLGSESPYAQRMYDVL